MTVNTNGNTPVTYDVHQELIELRRYVRSIGPVLKEVRESQLRTEELVKGFIENMSKNPMMKMMAGKFGA